MKPLRSALSLFVFVALCLPAACRTGDDDDEGQDPAPAVTEDTPPDAPEDPDPPPEEPDPEPPATLVTEIDQALMVYVPAGEFLMGTSAEDVERLKQIIPLRDPSAYDDERPQRTVYLDAFYIDRTEVTNTQYRRFLAATGYEAKSYVDWPPHDHPDYPALIFEWEDAARYADWAGKRLPTEAEWEKAARGTDGRIWPWGNEWDQSILSGNDGTGEQDGYVQTAPVGQFPLSASPYGALDTAGNVFEWTADWYDPDYYLYAPDANPQGPASGDGRSLRGGDWTSSFDFTRCASRQGGNPGSLLRGFRCVLDPPALTKTER